MESTWKDCTLGPQEVLCGGMLGSSPWVAPLRERLRPAVGRYVAQAGPELPVSSDLPPSSGTPGVSHRAGCSAWKGQDAQAAGHGRLCPAGGSLGARMGALIAARSLQRSVVVVGGSCPAPRPPGAAGRRAGGTFTAQEPIARPGQAKGAPGRGGRVAQRVLKTSPLLAPSPGQREPASVIKQSPLAP